MLTVKSAVTCEQGRVVSVEIVIPRIQDVKDVLMVVAPQHGTERIFEMQAGDISESHVRELGVFVLKSGGVR
jgi:hypothetical protein